MPVTGRQVVRFIRGVPVRCPAFVIDYHLRTQLLVIRIPLVVTSTLTATSSQRELIRANQEAAKMIHNVKNGGSPHSLESSPADLPDDVIMRVRHLRKFFGDGGRPVRFRCSFDPRSTPAWNSGYHSGFPREVSVEPGLTMLARMW